jgi:hypothetical protein
MIRAAILTPRAGAMERMKALVLDTLPSTESKRAYGQALGDFFHWCETEAASGFTKATVNAYRTNMEMRGLSPSTINQRLSAIRKLALEAADNGFMPPELASAISRDSNFTQRRFSGGLPRWSNLKDGLTIPAWLCAIRDSEADSARVKACSGSRGWEKIIQPRCEILSQLISFAS